MNDAASAGKIVGSGSCRGADYEAIGDGMGEVAPPYRDGDMCEVGSCASMKYYFVEGVIFN